jgi:hypothetical protein
MLKKLGKKTMVFVLCLSLLMVSSIGVFADEGGIVNTSTTATVSNNQLVDGGSCTQNIVGGNRGIFFLTVSDRDLRHIVVSSSAKVKTVIQPADGGLANFIGVDSGKYRFFNMIDMHFIPGVQYLVLVEPETTADVTVSMSKTSSPFTWVNFDNQYSLTEKNMLMSGETEFYGLAFQTAGLYKITISTASKLNMQFIDNDGDPQNFYGPVYSDAPRIFSFDVKAPTGDAQNTYGLYLNNTDAAGQGGAYTVTIERFY